MELIFIKSYILKIIITITLTYSIIFLLRFSLRQFFEKTNFLDEKREGTIESVFKNTTNYLAFFIIAITALKPFIEIKEILIAGGIFGAIVGFGAQSVIKDFLHGFFFLFEGQFKKGDFVNINGEPEGGTVEDLGFRAVKVRLLNGKLLTISNGEVLKVVNGNIERRRINESFIVSYRENPAKITELAKSICDELNELHSDYLKKNKDGEYEEKYKLLGLSSLDSTPIGYKFNIVATINDVDYINAVFETRELIANKLYENQIRMPEQSVFYQTRSTHR